MQSVRNRISIFFVMFSHSRFEHIWIYINALQELNDLLIQTVRMSNEVLHFYSVIHWRDMILLQCCIHILCSLIHQLPLHTD